MTLNTLVLRARVTETTIADYCCDRIDRKTAEARLRRAGFDETALMRLLDAADANLVLKANYRKEARS